LYCFLEPFVRHLVNGIQVSWLGLAFQTLEQIQSGAKKQHIAAAGEQAHMILLFSPCQLLKTSLTEQHFLSGPGAS